MLGWHYVWPYIRFPLIMRLWNVYLSGVNAWCDRKTPAVTDADIQLRCNCLLSDDIGRLFGFVRPVNRTWYLLTISPIVTVKNAFSMRFTLSPVCPSVCHACSMKEPGILHSCAAGIHCNVSICARIGGHINYTDFGLPKFSNIISAKKTQNTHASEYFRLAL